MFMLCRSFLFPMFAVFMLTGCTSETSRSTGTTASEAPAAGDASGATKLDDAISAWRSSKQDEAVKLLLDCGDDVGLDTNSRVLKLSEDDVKSMTREERTGFVNESIEVAVALKALAIHCMTLGDEALGRGNIAAARHYFEAVNRLGRPLQDRRHVVIMQRLGKFMVTICQERISRCENAAAKRSGN